MTPKGKACLTRVGAWSPNRKAWQLLTWCRAAAGLRDAAVPTRRAAAALLALIMAAGQTEYEDENRHPTGPELRARWRLRFWKPPTTWGAGRGLAAAAMKPALLLRRPERCLTRNYLSAAPGTGARGEHAPQHSR